MRIPFFSKDKDILDDLPESEKEFFNKQDSRLKLEAAQKEPSETKFATQFPPALSAKDKLALQNYNTSHSKKIAVLENCSEIQMMMLQCLKNGSVQDKLSMCGVKTSATFSCMEKQKTALTQLGYDSANSIEGKKYLQGKCDDLFVKNFGRDGLNNEGEKKFFEQVQQLRQDLWS